MARALSTLAIASSGIKPIYCFNLFLSIVRICSSKTMESLSSPSKFFTSVCVGNLHYEKFADGSMKCIEDEISFELPEGWAWLRLQSFVNFIGGSQPPKSTFQYSPNEDNIRLIQIRDYKTDKFITYIPRSKAKRFCNKDDVMIGRYGPPIFQILRGLEGSYNVALMKAVANPDLMLNDYLYYLLQDGELLHMLESLSDRTCGQDGINMYELNCYIVSIPPIHEQKKIINYLSDILPKVDAMTNSKDELSKLIPLAKSKILDLAIRGQLVPQDPNDEPASALLERIRAEKEELIKQGKIKRDKKESVIFKGEDNSYYEKIDGEVRCIDNELPFDLPDSWIYVRLKHIGAIIGGGTPKTNIKDYWDGNIPWLTPADFSGYEDMYVSVGARTITELGLQSSSAQMLPTNSVLFSSRAPIGYIAIAANPICTNQGFKSVVPYDSAMSQYLYYCLKARTDDIIQRATGTTFKEISAGGMAETIIPLPPLKEQTRIFNRICQLFNIINSIEKSLS